MGEHDVEQQLDERKSQAFMKALLEDLRALEYMIEIGSLETGMARIGAEQEMFLVDHNMRPAPISLEVLEHANDSRLTTEIARFNLEANLTPLPLSGRCFRLMEQELEELLGLVRKSAKPLGAKVLLSGILPTLKKSDLTLENLAPIPRYSQLNEGVIRLRGGPFTIHIKGLDELQITHDNIMMESCTTSFQVHFQTSPAEFASRYNMAQAITAPLLAAAVNSPLLFGHRLWQETRVALFQHSTDARSRAQLARSQPTRVSFGNGWLKNSVVELFHEQISRFRPIMITQPEEDPFQVLARGETPLLSALRMHNGTVWRWNRACYGVADGIAHLRIENRALPSGPTVQDEMANAAFFVGLMVALPQEYGEIAKRLSFNDAKENFFAAARHGLNAQLRWLDGKSFSATSLILNDLLPLARAGLKAVQVDSNDIDKYLGIAEERVRSGQTGAQWMLNSLASLNEHEPSDMRTRILTSTILARQQEDKPVHEWKPAEAGELDDWSQSYQTVGQFMSTDLFTLRPNDLVDLAASLMEWRHIRHVPVEDQDGRLVGLVTHRGLLRLLTRGSTAPDGTSMTVREIMKANPTSVTSTTPTLEAIEIMRRSGIGCLPVVDDDNQLVGIVTSYDFLTATASLFKQHLAASARLSEKPASQAASTSSVADARKGYGT
ncbi:MAG TPA: CBS domain-containing protein [Pyrinomonadaceae bacterium]|nr:CBS domain-containing protein [Pyrinomonadaceae bacterium]